MNVRQIAGPHDSPQIVGKEQAIQVAHGMRALSPQDIKAVAGGPEGSVGSGLNPPNSSNLG
jgi:hypothetical protein